MPLRAILGHRGAILGPVAAILGPLGAILGPLGAILGAKMVLDSPQDGFKIANYIPKMAKDDCNMALRWTTMAARWLQDGLA